MSYVLRLVATLACVAPLVTPSCRIPFLSESQIPLRCKQVPTTLQQYSVCAGMRFVREPDEMDIARMGSFKAFTCCATEYDSLIWYKNGVALTIPTNSAWRVQLKDHNQTLAITEARPSDKGNYTCKLRRNGKTIQRTTRLIQVLESSVYLYKPYMIQNLKNISVYTGETYTQTCEAFVGGGGTMGKRVKMFRNNKMLKTTTNISRLLYKEWKGDRIGGSAEHYRLGASIMLSPVKREDFGTKFECMAQNRHNRLFFEATVQEKEIPEPLIVKFDVRTEAKLGADVNLTCNAYFTDLPEHYWSIDWTVNGKVLNANDTDSKYSIDSSKTPYEDSYYYGKTLLVKDIEKEDYSKDYTCVINVNGNTTLKRAYINKPKPIDPLYEHLAAGLASVLFSAMVGLFLIYCFHLELRLLWRDKIRPKLPGYHYIHDAEYDTLAMCAPEDLDFTIEYILKPLEEKHRYRIFLVQRDCRPGLSHLDELVRATQSSRVILVILSRDFIDNEHCEFVMQQGIENKGQKVCFVKYKHISDWDSLAENRRDSMQALMNISPKITWPHHGYGCCPLVSPGPLTDNTHDSAAPDDINLSDRKYDRFYKRVRLALGRPLQQQVSVTNTTEARMEEIQIQTV